MKIRSRRLILGFALLVVILGLLSPQAWAWYQMSEARSALAEYHPEIAQKHLSRCLAIWPDSLEGHLLASRAARQQGNFEEADRQLRAAQELVDGTTEAIAFEWALLQAASGNLSEVEEFLHQLVDEDPGLSPLVWEAVAEGYIRVYRILDALAMLDYWLELEPDNIRALELRGLAYQNGKAAQRGAESLRQVIELDPTRDETRWRLVRCLLDMGSYDEALPHLKHLEQVTPDDPEVKVQLARCHNMLGRGELARRMLDEVLENHPDHMLGLRTRGQFALADDEPARAEEWLRRAVKIQPNDYQSQWLLFQSLQQQEKTEQAQEQLKVANEVRERTERFGELTSRQLSTRPLDPALHYEMGVLLLRNGQGEIAEGWLLSALNLDENYRPAHQALAEYYEQKGEKEKAEEHRRLAEKSANSINPAGATADSQR